MAHFIPSVAFLSTSSASPINSKHPRGARTFSQADAALQRALFEEEEEPIDAPLGAELFAHSPWGVRAGRPKLQCAAGVDEADDDQWLDEIGMMRDQIEYTRRGAEAKVRRTELQAARLAEVMSRTADGRVAAARRWAAREAHKHETLRYEKDQEWADIVAHVKAEASEVARDLSDARAENRRLQKQLADAALRAEKERRAAEKAQQDAVSNARREAETAAAAKYDALIAASDERARRAETRLASTAADWAEQLAVVEAREARAVELQHAAKESVAAEFTQQLARATARASVAEQAQHAAETRCVELEKESQEEELRRGVCQEAAACELQTTQTKLEEKTTELLSLKLLLESVETVAAELQAQLAHKDRVIKDMLQREADRETAVQEQLERSASEHMSLQRLLSQRSADLALLSERKNLRWIVYRRVWIRMCCRLLIEARTDRPLFALSYSTASDTDTEAEARAERNAKASTSRRPTGAAGDAHASRKRHRTQHARTLGRQRRVLGPASENSAEQGDVERIPFVPPEPMNRKEAEQIAAQQLSEGQRDRETERQTEPGVGPGSEAIFPLLERNPWLLALLPVMLLFMLTPLVILMTPELPPRVQ